MTIEKIADRTLAEWQEFARRDDCLDRMVPSDLRCIIAALRREREPAEPVAWRVRVQSDDAEEWSLLPAGGGADYSDRKGYECQPLYATPPDALDLVAAAYRDAAEQCLAEERRREDQAAGERSKPFGRVNIEQLRRWEGGRAQAGLLAKNILARTPADATAALAAIDRAAYERGVRDEHSRMKSAVNASAAIGRIVGFLGEDTDRIEAFRKACGPELLEKAIALLTQEGR